MLSYENPKLDCKRMYGINRFPQSFQGSMGGRRPDVCTSEMTGESASRMHLRHESRDLQKKAGTDGSLTHSVSLIFAILTRSLKRPGSIWAAGGLISQSAFVIP